MNVWIVIIIIVISSIGNFMLRFLDFRTIWKSVEILTVPNIGHFILKSLKIHITFYFNTTRLFWTKK